MRKAHHDLSDEQLMQRLQAGDEQAFNALYHRYSGKLHSYFWRMLNKNESIAEDFTQQLFMKIIENNKRFDIRQQFSTWLYTLASNMVKNEYRSRDRQSKRVHMAQHWQRDSSLDFIHDLDENIRNKRLQNAIDSLDEKHQQCFLLRHQQGFSIKEISDIIKCPEGTVKSRLHYALKYLSASLKKVRYS